jgi:hypothetical protein
MSPSKADMEEIGKKLGDLDTCFVFLRSYINHIEDLIYEINQIYERNIDD